MTKRAARASALSRAVRQSLEPVQVRRFDGADTWAFLD
jgi:hypothetical protein